MNFIAHVRKSDNTVQTLQEHLFGVSALCKSFSGKLNLEPHGELIGLLHDFGKYSAEFQTYIKSAVGMINPDEDNYVDSMSKKGKVDHSTSGAQFIWNEFKDKGSEERIVGQIFALCVASHHTGLMDCLTPDGFDNFSQRMEKPERKTHSEETLSFADKEIIAMVKAILASNLKTPLITIIHKIYKVAERRRTTVFYFHLGLLIRYLLSCLLDADRLNSANFEMPHVVDDRLSGKYPSWDELTKRLQRKLSQFSNEHRVDQIRADVSRHCVDKATSPKGLFTLTVPTGGGKTLSSLRFALKHAHVHKMDRIFYIIPYTSIIEQNADEVRRILESHYGNFVVLEHHSNLFYEEDGKSQWRAKLLAENWDAPVVFTTSVQFLDSLFGSRTTQARRMHQLSNAVIIFDEIQTLPIRVVHMFNNAINFLTEICGSSVVLCTATQPLLGRVAPEKGCLSINSQNEIIPDPENLFKNLKRVQIINNCKSGGWTSKEIADLAWDEIKSSQSVLVIVNTKSVARSIYQVCKDSGRFANILHLSTNMCAAHRTNVLNIVREKLSNEPLLCISTQLIEAGVDIDFGSVIRSIAFDPDVVSTW